MKMYCYWAKLHLVMFLLSKLCLCWKLPPVQFLSEFAEENDRTQLSILLPFGIPSMDKYFRQLTRENEMPTSLTFIKEGQNVNTSMNSQDLIVFVPDESDTEGCIKKLIQWFNQRKRTDKQYWLIDITYLSTINEKTNEILNDLKLDLDDDLFMFAYSSTGIELYEAYKIHENFDATVKPYGFWSFNNGLTSPMYGKWIRRKNMQGAKLNVVSNVQPPYVTQMIPVGSTTIQITQDYSPGEFEFKGMYADVFLELQNMLNFTFVLKKSPDGQWGTLRSDGTWTGMIRELQDQRVDIAATGFAMSVARSKVITYSETITESYNTLFIKNPSGTFNFKAYFEPLKNMSWFLIVIFCILAPVSLFAISRFEHEPMKSEFTWVKSQIFVLSALTMKGWRVSPNQSSSRCAFIVIILAGLVIYYYWEAMLVSYLSTRFIVLPFTNMKELLTNTDYRITMLRGTIQEDYFKASSDPVLKQAYYERIEPYLDEYDEFFDKQTIMEELPHMDESLALFNEFLWTSYKASYKNCEVISIPAKYMISHVAFGYQKHSPYQGIFDHYIKEMREKGALKQILIKYQTGIPVCPDLSGKALGFESCFSAFVILLSGMALGFLAFFLEKMIIPLYKFGNCDAPMFEKCMPDQRRRDQNE